MADNKQIFKNNLLFQGGPGFRTQANANLTFEFLIFDVAITSDFRLPTSDTLSPFMFVVDNRKNCNLRHATPQADYIPAHHCYRNDQALQNPKACAAYPNPGWQ